MSSQDVEKVCMLLCSNVDPKVHIWSSDSRTVMASLLDERGKVWKRLGNSCIHSNNIRTTGLAHHEGSIDFVWAIVDFVCPIVAGTWLDIERIQGRISIATFCVPQLLYRNCIERICVVTRGPHQAGWPRNNPQASSPCEVRLREQGPGWVNGMQLNGCCSLLSRSSLISIRHVSSSRL